MTWSERAEHSRAIWSRLKQRWKQWLTVHNCNSQAQLLFCYLKYLEYCHLPLSLCPVMIYWVERILSSCVLLTKMNEGDNCFSWCPCLELVVKWLPTSCESYLLCCYWFTKHFSFNPLCAVVWRCSCNEFQRSFIHSGRASCFITTQWNN